MFWFWLTSNNLNASSKLKSYFTLSSVFKFCSSLSAVIIFSKAALVAPFPKISTDSRKSEQLDSCAEKHRRDSLEKDSKLDRRTRNIRRLIDLARRHSTWRRSRRHASFEWNFLCFAGYTASIWYCRLLFDSFLPRASKRPSAGRNRISNSASKGRSSQLDEQSNFSD